MQIFIPGQERVEAGVSERLDGSMVWWNRKPVDPAIKTNRDAFFQRQGMEPSRVVSGGLIHGTTVAVVDDSHGGEYLLNTDALVTRKPNLFLAVTVADCLPIYYVDPIVGAVGIAHAGWKGVSKGMPEAVVTKMADAFGTRPENLIVFIGPHIQQHHYEVGQEVADLFDKMHVQNEQEKLLLDIGDAAKEHLKYVGVKNVKVDQTCTCCSAEQLFSARHDKSIPLKGAVAYIGLRRD